MSIELYAYDNDDLSVLLQKAAQARVFMSMVKDAKDDIDGALTDAVERVSAQTGTAFTARHEGWSAVLTDPQPQPFVSDDDAFFDWWHEQDELVDLARVVKQVHVLDHDLATDLLLRAKYEPVQDFSAAFQVYSRTFLPDNALHLLQSDYGYVVKNDRLAHYVTGEVVQGVSVRKAARQLRVTGKTEAKTRLRADLHAAMGMKGIE